MTTGRGASSRTLGDGSDTSPTRRQCLAGVCVSAATFLAGCTEGEPAEADDPDDAVPSEDGDEDATNTDDSTDTDESADSDGSMEADDSADTDEPAGTETDSGVNCGEVVPDVGDSVEIVGTMEHPEDGMVDLEGRTHGDDHYYEFVSPGGTFELFAVDGEYYVVSETGCAKFSTPPETGYVSPEDQFDEEGFWEDEDPNRTEVVDGVEMAVYEFSVSTPHYDYESTVYVNCDTRRIHRVDQYVPVEDSSTVTYYENWGGADPVAPPDMECQDV